MNFKQRYKRLSLWNKIAFWGSAASLVALLLAVLTLVVDFQPEPNGELSLVEALVIDGETEFATLDIKLRNTGPVAFLKEAIFQIEAVLPYRWIYCPYQVLPSGSYDVLLPTSGAPSTVRIPFSHAVPQGGVDRIQFVLAHDARVPDEKTGYAYRVTLKLVYNENDQVLKVPQIGFMVTTELDPLAYTNCRSAMQVYSNNKAIFRAFSDFNGVMSENLQTVVKKYDGSAVGRWLERLGEAGDDEKKVRYCMAWLTELASIEEPAVQALEELGRSDPRALVRELASEGLEAVRGRIGSHE